MWLRVAVVDTEGRCLYSQRSKARADGSNPQGPLGGHGSALVQS